MEDESFGIIPLRKKNNGWQVLLIKHKHGAHWGFPKGHPINDRETEIETASREFKEETNLEIEKILSQKGFIENYSYQKHGETINKRVKYFPAIVDGDLIFQTIEISEGDWFDLQDAVKKITFQGDKEICEQVIQFLKKSLR